MAFLQPPNFLKPTDTLTFGKHRGKSIYEVFAVDPDYLYWMLQTGFSKFGKEVTEGISEWEKTYPNKAQKVMRSIERQKARIEAGDVNKKDSIDKASDAVESIIQSQQVTKATKDPLFGSW